jgi:hypothetical protein
MASSRRKSNAAKRKEWDNGQFIVPEKGQDFSDNRDEPTAVAQAVVVEKWDESAGLKVKHSYESNPNKGGGNASSASSKGGGGIGGKAASFKKSLLWPVKLRDAVVDSFLRDPNEEGAKEYLSRCEFPPGLIQAVVKSSRKLPIRFYIIDDSGSMNRVDGRRIVKTEHTTIDSKTHKEKKVIEYSMKECTRWTELVVTIKFLAELSMKLQIPSEFRLLNGADPVMIGLDPKDDSDALAFLSEVLSEDPAGSTPLCQQVDAVG